MTRTIRCLRVYVNGDTGMVYSDGTWRRGPWGQPAIHGKADNQRAATQAADAAQEPR